MGKVKLCKWCRKHPAVVPEKRGVPGKFKAEICQQCHSSRLREDMRGVLKHYERKRMPPNEIDKAAPEDGPTKQQKET